MALGRTSTPTQDAADSPVGRVLGRHKRRLGESVGTWTGRETGRFGVSDAFRSVV